MRTLTQGICFGLLAAVLLQPVLAQPSSGGQRMQGGGINYAPRAADYSVSFVDARGHKVRLKAADGRTGVVDVPEGVCDLSKPKAGAKIRVDFVVPVNKNSPLKAASVGSAS